MILESSRLIGNNAIIANAIKIRCYYNCDVPWRILVDGSFEVLLGLAYLLTIFLYLRLRHDCRKLKARSLFCTGARQFKTCNGCRVLKADLFVIAINELIVL